ncbi:LysR family transcriptional regulator [Marinomonas spartinae]|uniref:LysR family transcriptional regulator n=1 Tax=Marinomonas spartinae TaxID=1792290 RepID=UPI0018F1D95A|nr:LysR family transcriptional regulator [Marinomonas spartinae]MBJ7553700.1 LysR family transcriptional regulator [Marinomonas spartinae]
MLNTHHLETFKTLVETGSFTQTAQRLGLTQPAVSQHIKKLEQGLGATLLVRHGRTTELTAAGKVLVQHINELENCYARFISQWDKRIANSKKEADQLVVG